MKSNQVILTVKVTPSAKRNMVMASKDGIWSLKIAAPAINGRANNELLAFLSKTLGIRKNALSMIKGLSSRKKFIAVSGMNQEQITLKLSSEL
jgi:uncharacterized protein (TIGR00251 family)